MNDYYLKIETTTGIRLYTPSEWDSFTTGNNFLIVHLLNDRNDMYSLQHVLSVQQNEAGLFLR